MSPVEDLKELRKSLGLSQSQFAKKFGIPCRTIQKWECGASEPKPYLLAMMHSIVEQESANTVPEKS